MKTQSLQIYVTLAKPQVTNLCDLKHQVLQDLAMLLAWVLFPEPLGFRFLGKFKLQAEQSWWPESHLPSLCRGSPVWSRGGRGALPARAVGWRS